MTNIIKRILDRIASAAKQLEETLDPEATVLEGFERSLQIDTYSCGVQSTFMILRHFGKARTALGVERALGTTEEGTDQYQIRELLTKRGLIARRIQRPTIAKLRQAIDDGCPVLVCVDSKDIEGGHWAVVYGYSPGHVFVADPSLRRAILCRHTTEEFRSRWDKWAMIVEKQTIRRRRKPHRPGRER
jgi:ABC-type bacteriocin/lantibiotic exporter with double-glycine peptidase domain